LRVDDREDEILLAALDCISGKENPIIDPVKGSVYPNPASTQFKFSYHILYFLHTIFTNLT
jgi:hypothetical protein